MGSAIPLGHCTCHFYFRPMFCNHYALLRQGASSQDKYENLRQQERTICLHLVAK